MIRFYYSILSALMVVALAFASCGSKTDEPSVPTAEIGKEVVDFQAKASTINLPITTNIEGWTAKSDQPWCEVRPLGKSLRISVQASQELSVREATVTLTFSSIVRTLKVRQLGTEPTILVDKTIFNLPVSGGRIDFVVTSNVEIEVKVPEWIVPPSQLRSTDLVEYPQQYVARPNTGATARAANIEIRPKGQTSAKLVLVAVNQSGMASYQAVPADDIKGDVKVAVVGGQADSEQPGQNQGIDKSYDGDYATLYHSAWGNNLAFPITLDYHFGKVEEVDYLIYYPRQDGGTNGHFKVVDIYYTADGSSYQKLMQKDFNESGNPTRVVFAAPVKAKGFRFVVQSGKGHAGSKGFVSCSEMEFYTKNPERFDYKTLFKDELCTELKDGITEADITASQYPFFKNIAMYMLHGQYSREFRVDSYKAYPLPTIISATNKAQPYSLLDNPTGIEVEANEDLVAIVGDTYGRDLAICVVNYDTPGADGFNSRKTYPLYRGVNKIRMTHKGLVYVMYHTSTLEAAETAQPIKIHFASGRVNGYFDSQRASHQGRWGELLGKAGKYFDVVGQYTHLAFPSERFRRNTPDGKALIDAYDLIVRSEQELHGLHKYNRMNRNRMLLHVIYTSYMYATWYHTAYNDTTLDALTNVQSLSTSNMWGPAHEIGHVNQTRPGVLWRGMTEVTVNIPSQYIQTTVFGAKSRLQTENMDQARPHSRYTKSWNQIFVPKIAFCESTDVFCQLVPFWQLELYFGKVLGRTPLQQPDKGGFYPDLYEYVRTHPDKPNAGAQQLEFPYIASVTAQLDLTEYFEKWGFFKPVDKSIKDYSTEQLTITEAQAAEVKARIAALRLPKPDIALEYITDHTVEVYKGKLAVVAGSATRSGQTITLTGWRHAVAYEVLDASGQVVYLSDTGIDKDASALQITLPSGITWGTGFTMRAIAYDGARTAVNL